MENNVTNTPNTENEGKKMNIWKKALNKVLSHNNEVLTAESAWLATTYWDEGDSSVEKRILNKQRDIANLIKSKFRYDGKRVDFYATRPSYHCIVDIEQDLEAHKEKVLEPFVSNGFTVVNISEQVKEIENENVFLISWKNAFTKS